MGHGLVVADLRPGSTLIQVALGAASALATLSLIPDSAKALVVNVGGTNYDVTTFTGKFSDNVSKFATPASGGVMPWWGDEGLAAQFAAAVNGNLGYPNSLNENSEFYAYSVSTGVNMRYKFSGNSNTPAGFFGGSVSPVSSYTWAQASLAPAAVPAPLPLFGAAAAFGFSRRLKKRIQATRRPLGPSHPNS